MKQLAIIGSTASGKSDLALELAQEYNAIILSIDSLSIYRTIDIASAKPSHSELSLAEHFGIDRLNPDENANVITFIDEYQRAREKALRCNQNLIIVGGSSFYLKSMLEGLSPIPEYSSDTIAEVRSILTDLSDAHRILSKIDPVTMEKIAPSDAYRIEKMALLYLETKIAPSEWFRKNPPIPIITECPILELKSDREILRQRIILRTDKMVRSGLIDEVASLEHRYGRAPNSMKAIGIIETLAFLDGIITKSELLELISTHTAQLAKRQQTFNTHQFSLHASGERKALQNAARLILKQS